MALGRKRSLTAIALVLMIISGLAVVLNLYWLHESRQFNMAIEQEAFEQVVQDPSIHGLFAKAYLHQQQGEFDRALVEYIKIESVTDPTIRSAVKFNMANLYLRKGAEAERQGAKDLSEPLIELAKQHYRELLRDDSQDWSAKYNLEMALRLLPDLEQKPPVEDIMPERSPRALGTVESVEQLP